MEIPDRVLEEISQYINNSNIFRAVSKSWRKCLLNMDTYHRLYLAIKNCKLHDTNTTVDNHSIVDKYHSIKPSRVCLEYAFAARCGRIDILRKINTQKLDPILILSIALYLNRDEMIGWLEHTFPKCRVSRWPDVMNGIARVDAPPTEFDCDNLSYNTPYRYRRQTMFDDPLKYRTGNTNIIRRLVTYTVSNFQRKINLLNYYDIHTRIRPSSAGYTLKFSADNKLYPMDENTVIPNCNNVSILCIPDVGMQMPVIWGFTTLAYVLAGDDRDIWRTSLSYIVAGDFIWRNSMEILPLNIYGLCWYAKNFDL